MFLKVKGFDIVWILNNLGLGFCSSYQNSGCYVGVNRIVNSGICYVGVDI